MTTTIGVVLAGGASRRMGRDKTRIQLATDSGSTENSGSTLLERAFEVLGQVCSEVVIADRGRQRLRGAVSVNDGAGAGPAAGILGAADARPGCDLLVLACDTPRVPSALLRALIAEEGDWVVPVWGEEERLEPLCALYRRGALEALDEQIRRGVHAVHRLAGAPDLHIRRLRDRFLEAFGPPPELFLNLNTPKDLAILQEEELAG